MNKDFGVGISYEEIQKRTSPIWPYKYFNPGSPVEPEEVNELLKGVVDIHVHGAPAGSWLSGRPTIVNTCVEASLHNVAGLVFKDHNCMINNAAIIVNDFLAILKKEKASQGLPFTPTDVYGGITLNYGVGGMNVHAVKTALGYGRCVEVWLPSLNSKHQHKAMGQEGGIEVSSEGELTNEMKEVLDVLAEYNDNSVGKRCALATCHVSNEEKFDILKYIKKRGMDVDIIIDHITQELTIATYEECIELIELGAYLQFAETSCVPWTGMQDWVVAFDYSFNLIKKLIKEKGSNQLVLSSDSGQPGHEFIPGWKSFLKTLLAQGVSKDDVRNMSSTIPMKIIGKV